jgi:pimeloyl-ACP methyl ester carboxylesterase
MTVALCDGILCEGFVWKYLRPALLDAGYSVLHWNYRGHGQSEGPRNVRTMTIVHMAEDLWRVLDSAEVPRAVIAGHSMGSQVCLEAYRLRPEKTQGLMLLCGSYGKVTKTFHGTDALALALPAMRAFTNQFPAVVRGLVSRTPPSIAVRAARLLGEIDADRVREEDMQPYFEHMATMDPQVYLTLLDDAGKHTAEELLHEIAAPTLVLAAGKDSFTPPRLARQMARTVQHGTLVEVSDATHTLPIEQPGLVNASVLEFLARIAR